MEKWAEISRHIMISASLRASISVHQSGLRENSFNSKRSFFKPIWSQSHTTFLEYILLQIFVLKLTLRDKFYYNTTPGQAFDRKKQKINLILAESFAARGIFRNFCLEILQPSWDYRLSF